MSRHAQAADLQHRWEQKQPSPSTEQTVPGLVGNNQTGTRNPSSAVKPVTLCNPVRVKGLLSALENPAASSQQQSLLDSAGRTAKHCDTTVV